jgi:hypothetical protein
MPSCRTCGLSMSETAEFCPTCGARPVGETSAAAYARPPWTSAEMAAPDGFTQSSPTTASTAKPSILPNNNTRLAIAAGVVVLVIVLTAVFMHAILSGARSERYTVAEYNRIKWGLTLAQVEAIIGGPPTTQSQYPDGTASAQWVNPDGSRIWVGIENGVVAIKDTFGPHSKGHMGDSQTTALGVWGLAAVVAAFSAVVFGACLFLAARLLGYSITVTQVIIFAVVCGALRMVPVIGGLLSLFVGVALIERWSDAGWWTSLLIILVAWFIAAIAVIAVLGAGAGLGLAL